MMNTHHAELERMRAARRRLARARQRVRRLSWMARDPDSLDPQLPLLSRAAFVRALARFQTIRLHRDEAALLAFRLPCEDMQLRRAAAMHLLENTRNCDTPGCADPRTFLVLLKGSEEAGALAAMHRLQADLRQLAVHTLHRLAPVSAACLPLAPEMEAARALQSVLGRLETATAPTAGALTGLHA